MRGVPEWIGKHADSRVPPHVRVRVFERCGGVCHISKRPIRPGEAWALDHVIALINGGEHREFNLAPILADQHKEKTKTDVSEKSLVYRKKAKHLGIVLRKSRPIPGSKSSGLKKGFDGIVRKR